MGFRAQVLADSIGSSGIRLTTMEVTYPRIIHSEMLRHRVFSRCAASSRAIPVHRFIDQVVNDPYIPSAWGANRPGMQAGEDLDMLASVTCEKEWLKARDCAVDQAIRLLGLGVHKQLTNRLLEPFQWMTEIITATEWSNFYHLRIHPDAHPDIQRIARAMIVASKGGHVRLRRLKDGEWHLPLVTDEDLEAFSDSDPAALPTKDIPLVSIGRVARTSYLKHEDTSAITKDIDRSNKMLHAGHMSPFEHVARSMTAEEIEFLSSRSPAAAGAPPYLYTGIPFLGNLRGWVSYRKTIPNESDMLEP